MLRPVTWKRQLLYVSAILAVIHLLLYIFGRSSATTLWYRNDRRNLDYLEQFRRETANVAIKDLRTYLAKNSIEGPLYANPLAKKLCVGILSVPRKGNTMYLTQTVTALLTREKLERQKDVKITLYNVTLDPKTHTEALSLSDLVTVKTPKYHTGKEPKKYTNFLNFTKEHLDHLAVLEDLYSQGCDYNLVIEDDAMASYGWADEFLKASETIDPKRPWFIMKLFSPIRWIHWRATWISDILLIIFLSIVFSALVMLLLSFARYYLVRRSAEDQYESMESGETIKQHRFREYIIIPSIPTILLLLAGMGAFVAIIGKYTIFPLTRGVHDISLGFSCVANVFPHRSLRLLIDYVIKEFDRHEAAHTLHVMRKKDLYFQRIVQDYYEKSGVKLRELILIPNTFQHIGLYSSLDRPKVEKELLLKYMCTTHHYPDDDKPIEFDPANIT